MVPSNSPINGHNIKLMILCQGFSEDIGEGLLWHLKVFIRFLKALFLPILFLALWL